jgi:hypothetical protein
MRYILPKRRLTFNALRGVISQNISTLHNDRCENLKSYTIHAQSGGICARFIYNICFCAEACFRSASCQPTVSLLATNMQFVCQWAYSGKWEVDLLACSYCGILAYVGTCVSEEYTASIFRDHEDGNTRTRPHDNIARKITICITFVNPWNLADCVWELWNVAVKSMENWRRNSVLN